MPPRTWEERVRDILDAIDEIDGFVKDMDFDTFQNDARTMKAVELDLIVIGEAASHIPEEIQQEHLDVPWHLMRALRNRLVHVYFSVDPYILWETTQNDLPKLSNSLIKLLEK